MKQHVVAGNWKMNTSRSEAEELVDAIRNGVSADLLSSSLDVVIFPPFVWLEQTIGSLNTNHGPMPGKSPIICGAQDCHHEIRGAFTGDVSAAMIADTGCSYVIVGHSERRQYHGETNAVVARKIAAAVSAGLRPIVCVGESAEERAAGCTAAVVTRQIDEIIDGVGAEAIRASVVAYEPLWAIGTGIAASPEQAQEAHAVIRARLSAHGAPATPILYGGSVNALNASAYFACQDIDGALVGGASLSADTFLSIIDAASAAWAD